PRSDLSIPPGSPRYFGLSLYCSYPLPYLHSFPTRRSSDLRLFAFSLIDNTVFLRVRAIVLNSVARIPSSSFWLTSTDAVRSPAPIALANSTPFVRGVTTLL